MKGCPIKHPCNWRLPMRLQYHYHCLYYSPTTCPCIIHVFSLENLVPDRSLMGSHVSSNAAIQSNSHRNNASGKLQPISPLLVQIMSEQQLLFDGYFRAELSKEFNSNPLMTNDVATVCSKFYIINIQSMVDEFRETLSTKRKNVDLFNDPNLRKRADIFVLEELCRKLIKDKEFYFAYQIFEWLITSSNTQRNKDMAFHHAGLAYLLARWNKRQFKKTIKTQYETAIALDHKNYYWSKEYAWFLREIEEYGMALAYSKKAASLNWNKNTITDIALCYNHINDGINAEKYYKKALQFAPNNASCHRKYVRFSLENGYYQGAKQVIKSAKKALELDPLDCRSWYLYATLLRDHILDYDRAEMYYLRYMKMKKLDTNASYGYLLYLMGRYEEASKHIKMRYIEDNQGEQGIWQNVYFAVLNEKLGNKEIAEESVIYAAECVKTKFKSKKVKKELKLLEMNDKNDISVYKRFQQLLSDKFN